MTRTRTMVGKAARGTMISSSSTTSSFPSSASASPAAAAAAASRSHTHLLVRNYSHCRQQYFFNKDYDPRQRPPRPRRQCCYSSTTTNNNNSNDGGGGGDQFYYYDSQSGLHLPVHNEREIQLFLDLSTTKMNNKNTNGKNSTSSSSSPLTFVIPNHLYKDGDPGASDIPEQINELQRNGIHGVIVPPIEFPRDIRNLQTLRSLLLHELNNKGHHQPTFQFFTTSSYSGDSLWQEFFQRLSSPTKSTSMTSTTTEEDLDSKPTIQRDGFGGMLIEFERCSQDLEDTEESDSTATTTSTSNTTEQLLSRCIQSNIPTSLSITLGGAGAGADHDENNNNNNNQVVDPISLSNSVATLLDKYPSAGSFGKIFVDTTSASSSSQALSVIEELIYLDVAGPTIKSRLVVQHSLSSSSSSSNDNVDYEDLIEDVMFAGVNKFVVTGTPTNLDEENDDGYSSTIELISEVAVDQGKELKKTK
eukprot:CAMPEP_0113463680 /NCGR_PEP_ID=MMETSP0014_2-20120614/12788_1 /TAXON_ID=2857 /ORGANISM="Nitzschia sp." /LENGTH=474 /DNA_ID=CAMNT_0000355693 /DNA_START=278 /DNA_END=1702 /DNA_ORIENTATION=+ /assembly_acc=CAM_ASM_000159